MNHTVLLVEDSNTIRHIIKIYLMKLKLGFLDASGGEQGLQLLETNPVHLIIADVNMPGGMDGLEFVRKPVSIEDLATVVRRHLPLSEDASLVA